MSAHACDDCGLMMRVRDTAHFDGKTFRKLECVCGQRFESVETRSRRLTPVAANSHRLPPIPTGSNPSPQVGGGVGGGPSDKARLTLRINDPDPTPGSLSNPIRGRARGNGRAETVAFVRFYDRYLRKKKRPQALAAWIAQGCEEIADEVMAGLERAMPELLRRPPDRVPYPATWLNGREWTDPELQRTNGVPEKVSQSRELSLRWAQGREAAE